MGVRRFGPLSVCASLLVAAPAAAVPGDGTYSGTSSIGGDIEVVVSGGVVTSWSISSLSPSGSGCPSNLTTSLTTCCTVGDSFTCGSPALCSSTTFCAPNAVPYFLVSGTFSGTSVTGTYDFRFQGVVITIPPPCCSHTGKTWSADKPGPTCSPAAALACGDQVAGDSLGKGSTSVIDDYACGGGEHAASEYAYTFSPGEILDVRFALNDGSTAPEGGSELDLFVLEDVGGGCDPSSCVAAGTEPGNSEVVDVTTEASTDYYVVIDDAGGFLASTYQLDVVCALFRDGFEAGNHDRWIVP